MSGRPKSDEADGKSDCATAGREGRKGRPRKSRSGRRARTVRTDNNRMWDSADVADYLKVSIDWVRRHYNLGHLPGGRLPSGHLRFEPETVRAYARGEWKPTAAPTIDPA